MLEAGGAKFGKGEKNSYGIVEVEKANGGGSNWEADCLGGDGDVPIWTEEGSVILCAWDEIRDEGLLVRKGVDVEGKWT